MFKSALPLHKYRENHLFKWASKRYVKNAIRSHLRSHQAQFQSSSRVLPLNTSHRHKSIRYPNGRKVILPSAIFMRKLMSASGSSSTVSSRPIWCRCLGVATLRANTSPTASWNPVRSFQIISNRNPSVYHWAVSSTLRYILEINI